MANKPFTIQLDAAARDRLATVADAAHLDATKYAAVVLGKFSDLRPEFALDALASIPKDFFRGRPGRPPATAGVSDTNTPTTLQHVRE